MKSRRCYHYGLLILLPAALSLGLGNALAQSDKKEAEPVKQGAWTPKQDDRAAYRDIVDFNIFLADRRRLADKVDRDRNPKPPTEVVIRDPDPVKPEDPPHPDSFWRFTGTGNDPEGIVAFIENTKTGELSRITQSSEFSLGKIDSIGYDQLIYVVEGEERVIHVGESLLGKRVTPPGGATRVSSGGSSSSGSSSGSGSLADRLREMRERRAREQGDAPASDTPPADGAAPQPQPDGNAPASDPTTPAEPATEQPVTPARTPGDR